MAKSVASPRFAVGKTVTAQSFAENMPIISGRKRSDTRLPETGFIMSISFLRRENSFIQLLRIYQMAPAMRRQKYAEGMEKSRLSTLSITPPWPGMRLL